MSFGGCQGAYFTGTRLTRDFVGTYCAASSSVASLRFCRPIRRTDVENALLRGQNLIGKFRKKIYRLHIISSYKRLIRILLFNINVISDSNVNETLTHIIIHNKTLTNQLKFIAGIIDEKYNFKLARRLAGRTHTHTEKKFAIRIYNNFQF